MKIVPGKKDSNLLRFSMSWGYKVTVSASDLLEPVGEEVHVQTTRGCLAGWNKNGKYWALPTARAGWRPYKPCSVSPDLYQKVLFELDRHGVFEKVGQASDSGGDPYPSVEERKKTVGKKTMEKGKEWLVLPNPSESRQTGVRCG